MRFLAPLGPTHLRRLGFLVCLSALVGCEPPDSDRQGPPPDTDTDEEFVPMEVSGLDWYLHDSINSLVYVIWEQNKAGQVHVEYSFDDDVWLSSASIDAPAGMSTQLLVGIPYGESAEWRVVAEGADPTDGPAISTNAIPPGLPQATVVTADDTAWLPEGKYLLTSINQNEGGWTDGTYWTFIVDRQGRPIWARTAPQQNWTLYAQVSVSKDHILWDNATAWSQWDHGAGSRVHRTYLDAEIESIATPGLHHAFVELPDGTLAWGSRYHNEEESLVEKAPGATEETIIWVCNSWYCESNCLYYQEATNTYLYSFYTSNTLFEVDRATGESIWWAGGTDGGYDFDPADSKFYWQHGVTYTAAGTLLLSTAAKHTFTSMVREYTVDHKTKTLTQIWSYDAGEHAATNGDAWRLSNGNTLHTLGSAGVIVEADSNGTEVWRLDFNGNYLLGRSEFIEDPYTLVQPISVSSDTGSAER